MNIAIDIDDTITEVPQLFSLITEASLFKKVIIVSSRTNNEETRIITEKELSDTKIKYNKLFLLESFDVASNACPHDELDWYSKYLWQKVDICQKEQIDIVFEDDEKVITLFKKYVPSIKVIQIHKNM